MKLINKLALVAAMSVSANAMALQAMDDEALSATTGQDGITLQVFTQGITIEKLFLHDNDGLDAGLTQRGFDSRNKTAAELQATPSFTNAYAAYITANAADPLAPTAGEQADAQAAAVAATIAAGQATVLELDSAASLGGTGNAGALIIEDVSVMKNGAISGPTKAFATIKIDTDGGSAVDSSGAFLNVGVDLAAMDISVGSISVGKSNAAISDLSAHSGARRGVDDNGVSEIISGLTLSLGEASLNVQLGAQPQGAMIVLDAQIAGGLLIKDLVITDNDGAKSQSTYQMAVLNAIGGAPNQPGQIKVDGLKITTAGETFLDSNVKINVDKNLGLAVSLSNTDMDIYAQGIRLGQTTSASIGDLEIQGMSMGGSTLFVRGH